MPNLKGLIFLGSVASFTACASGNVLRVAGIKSTDESGISQCKYLDTVYGTSGWYGVFTEKGLANARASAFEKQRRWGDGCGLDRYPPASRIYGRGRKGIPLRRCSEK